MAYTNDELYRAYLALIEMGRATKPDNGPPKLAPFPAPLAFRFALNRNHLKPVIEAIEEQMAEIQQNPDSGMAAKRLRELAREQIAWSAPAPIKVAQLGDRQIPDDWLSAWLTVGIIEE